MISASLARSAALAACAALALIVSACSGGGTRPADGGGGGSCSPACGGFDTCCAEGDRSICANLGTNPRHCGACGNACVSGVCRGAICQDGDETGPPRDGGGTPGMCSPSCSSAQRCCGTTCVNRMGPAGADGRSDSSFTNCNGCGLECDAERASACGQPLGGGGAPRCLCGSFEQCAPGQVCVNSSGSFQCTDLNNDPMNCGELGNACADGEICSAGMCSCGGGARCMPGTACCGGACVDVLSNAMHCGMCDNACGTNGPDCVEGSCRCGSAPACTAPMPSADPLSPGMPGESCCDSVCVPNTTSSCNCEPCMADQMCVVAGGFFPGMGGDGVCCSDDPFGLLCGGGFPMP